MIKITRGWPPARRKAQAERIRTQKPWLHSTGPRTIKGKQRTRLNGLKHNMRSAAMRRLRRALQKQRYYMRLLEGDFVKGPQLAAMQFGRAGFAQHRHGQKTDL